MTQQGSRRRFAICIRDTDCDDLERGRVYAVLPDPRAQREGYLRVVDESGEDYLYPESYFVPVKLPQRAQAALAEVF